MEQRAGAQISRRAFVQSLVILFVLMMLAGVLTRVIPSGQYTRVQVEGREVIDPASFRFTPRPDYPIWRWFTAPFEAPFAPGGSTVLVIIVFLLFIGGAFAVLDKTGIIQAVLSRIVGRYRERKYALLLVISFFFMIMGAFFGIFEEVVPLVPLMIALAYSLGWDAFVGLGMSILATNLGFTAAITNPFTIGVAQQLAGLPLFSGAGLRVAIFAVVYAIFAHFLTVYARRIERDPATSLIHGQDEAERTRYAAAQSATQAEAPHLGRAVAWFLAFVVLILAVLLTGPFIPAISSYALPLVGVLFLIGGTGAGLLSGAGGRTVWAGLHEGIIGILPAVPLILMAVSISFIVSSGGVMDTILHAASQSFTSAGPYAAALTVFGLALVIEFFVASGSAKAFLMMPILLPLGDLIGVTRQTTVLAYCFGDGFSNLAYPTNPVLLISLGLTVISYPQWMRWTAKLWLRVLLASVAFLGIAVAIHFGPF